MIARRIGREDILSPDAYAAVRSERRRAVTQLKRNRRIPVGPDATFYFENYHTMWHQIHEMLHIERGGEAQIEDELRAYNPLVPQGEELVATLMFEIDAPVRRAAFLARLGGVEKRVLLTVGDRLIPAVSEEEVERTTAEGKTSSIHFLHFPFDRQTIAAFRDPTVRVTLVIDHPEYGHAAVLPEAVRQALAEDFV